MWQCLAHNGSISPSLYSSASHLHLVNSSPSFKAQLKCSSIWKALSDTETTLSGPSSVALLDIRWTCFYHHLGNNNQNSPQLVECGAAPSEGSWPWCWRATGSHSLAARLWEGPEHTREEKRWLCWLGVGWGGDRVYLSTAVQVFEYFNNQGGTGAHRINLSSNYNTYLTVLQHSVDY